MTTRLRRWLRIASFVAAVFVGLIVVAIVATQTAWFKDWLRRYVIREADQYLNGHLVIRRLDGNLFTGIEIEGVEITQDKQTVFLAKDVGLRYSLIDLLSNGTVIDAIRINEPQIHLSRGPNGWNVAGLVKEQAKEADREGPAKPLTIRAIGISNGTVTIVDAAGAAQTLPKRIDRIDLQGSFAYQPVDFRIEIGHLSLRTADPALALNDLSGSLVVNEDDVTIRQLAVRTAESSLSMRGSVHAYLDTPTLDVKVTSDKFTPRELAGFVPALADVRVQPAFELTAHGSLEGLVAELALRSDAGNAKARLVADLDGPDRRVKGEATIGELDLSRVAASLPASKVTGVAQVDLALDAKNDIDGRAHVRLAPTAVDAYRVEALEARATFAHSRMTVDAVADAYGAHATAAGVVVPPIGGRTLSGRLEGRVAGLDLRRLPRATQAPALDTRVAASYDVALDARGPSGTVVFDPSTVEGATIDAGTRVSGTLYGDRPTFVAVGGIRGVDPHRFARALRQPALDDPRLAGRLDATFDVQGSGRTLRTLEATGKIGVPRATVAGGEVRDVLVDARLTRGAADGTLTAAFTKLDPGLATDRPALAGAITGTLDGAFAAPDVAAVTLPEASGRVQLTLGPSRIGDQVVDRGVLAASLAHGVADVATLDVSGPLAQVTASGPVSLTREGASALRYEIVAADLAPAAALAGTTGVAGSGHVEGTLSGNLAELHTAGTLALSNAAYGTTARAVDTTVQYDVTLPELEVARASVTGKARAALVDAGGQSLREVTADVRYAARQAGFDVRVADTGDRRVEAGGTVTLPPGTGTEPLALQLDRLTLAAGDTAWALTSPAHVVYGNDRVDVDRLTLASGAQRIEAAGALALGQGGARSVPGDRPLRLTVTDVDLAAVDRLARTGRGLAGTVNATATASGSVEAPIAELKATVRDGAFGDFHYASLDATVKHDAQAAHVDARLDRGAEWLTLRGTLPPAPVLRDEARRNTAPIDVHVESSTIDLGVAQAFTTALKDVTGTLDANVHATGTLAAPVLDGSVRVANGAFALTADGTPFTGLSADIGLGADRLDVRRFEIADRQGHRLTATGGAAMSLSERTLGKVDVRLTGDDFRVLDGDFGRLALDLNLGVNGGLNALRAEGTVTVRSGRIEVDKVLAQVRPPAQALEIAPGPAPTNPTPAAATTGGFAPGPATATANRPAPAPAGSVATPAAGPASTSPSLLDGMALDVRVDVPNTLILRGDDVKLGGEGLSLGNLNMTLGGDLQATKAPGGSPLVVGSIHTVRGYYEFQGRRFELRRDGTVAFKGPDATNPQVDVTATRDISGVEARVRVHGEAQRPELELSSAPPLDEGDILSLIIFNRPINDLGEGEKTTLASRAGSLVGGFVAAPVATALRNALDVDQLDITPVSEDGGGASVSVGNQIGERVFVKVRQQFGSSETTQLVLEYELSKRLRLETAVAQGGDTSRSIGRRAERGGADLVFVVKY